MNEGVSKSAEADEVPADGEGIEAGGHRAVRKGFIRRL
jgi:hypothetical protein